MAYLRHPSIKLVPLCKRWTRQRPDTRSARILPPRLSTDSQCTIIASVPVIGASLACNKRGKRNTLIPDQTQIPPYRSGALLIMRQGNKMMGIRRTKAPICFHMHAHYRHSLQFGRRATASRWHNPAILDLKMAVMKNL